MKHRVCAVVARARLLFAATLCLALMLPWWPIAAQDVEEQRFVVIEIVGGESPELIARLRSIMERRVAEIGSVVAYRSYMKAADEAGLTRRKAGFRKHVIAVGGGLGVTRALLLQGTAAADQTVAVVSLLDIESGEISTTARFPLADDSDAVVVAAGDQISQQLLGIKPRVISTDLSLEVESLDEEAVATDDDGFDDQPTEEPAPESEPEQALETVPETIPAIELEPEEELDTVNTGEEPRALESEMDVSTGGVEAAPDEAEVQAAVVTETETTTEANEASLAVSVAGVANVDVSSSLGALEPPPPPPPVVMVPVMEVEASVVAEESPPLQATGRIEQPFSSGWYDVFYGGILRSPNWGAALGLKLERRFAEIPYDDDRIPFSACYCQQDGQSNTPYAGLDFAGSVYPLAMLGFDGLLSAVGVRIEASLSYAQSLTEVGERVDSTVTALGAAALLRLGAKPAHGLPEAELALGYSQRRFPLRIGAFPGIRYRGPWAGLNVSLPLPLEFSVRGDARLDFSPAADKGVRRMGDSQTDGAGYSVGLGVSHRVPSWWDARIIPLAVGLDLRRQHVFTTYRGESSLRGEAPQVHSGQLRDDYYTASVTFSYLPPPPEPEPVVCEEPPPPPDTDGDGVLDMDDACVTEPGPVERRGCPHLDSDGDGLFDDDDACPWQVGLPAHNGCPFADRDGDGVEDINDQCPDIAGLLELMGCPDRMLITVTATMIEIREKISFATGSAEIEGEVSFAILDQVSSVLRSRSEIILSIEGHTDNIGGEEYNLDLSRRRAESIVAALVERGIDAARITSEGYGFGRPLVENDTPEHRAQNRRVEFHIVDM